MELKFLGRGNAFNYKECNNSAFILEKDNLFLLDCGSLVFAKIMGLNLLDKVNNLYIFITHLHPDHAGSLGTLIDGFYFYMNKNKKPCLVCASEKQKNMLVNFLNITGTPMKHYDFADTNNLPFKSFNSVGFTQVKHQQGMLSYAIEFATNGGLIVFTGDTCDIHYIKKLFDGQKIDKLYVETVLKNISGLHMPFDILKDIIPKDRRKDCYIMHIGNQELIDTVKKEGFNVVEVVKGV